MNILLIDDEPLVLQMLQKKIPWQEIGIDLIYTANDTRFARQLLQTFSIQILVCDIEMPGENGLDFLKWVKENISGSTVSLLLTCHDDFNYAKAGIQLGVYDYLVKPIAYPELTQVLKNAVKEYKKLYSDQQQIQDGQLWKKHLDSTIRAFWQDYFRFSGSYTPEKMNELGIPSDAGFLLISFRHIATSQTLQAHDIIALLEQQVIPAFSYLKMDFSIFSNAPQNYHIVGWNSSAQDSESIPYLYAQMKKITTELHMNQLDLYGCMNHYTSIGELIKMSAVFQKFFDQLTDNTPGFFLVDSSAQLSEQYDILSSTSLLNSVSTYVRRHLASEISRQEIADYVHLNPDYITRIFKKKAGMNLSDYIRQERLNYAKHLLKNTELSISEIALTTGFNSPSYFSSTFHKEYKITPADFRNQISGTSQK